MYYSYSRWLKERYGEKVYKLPVNLPVSCPNRRGGQKGCSFCSEQGTGFEAVWEPESVTAQMQQVRQIVEKRYKAHKFIAYFQNYTNTYMPMEQFRACLAEASCFPDIVEISVSTRPDCIREDYLQYMADLQEKTGIQMNIELGLQTANYHTLDTINRGHGLAEYIDAMLAISRYSFTTCTHLIANLPGDTLRDAVETARIVSVLGTDIVKIHSLYIAKDSQMAEAYQRGQLSVCSKEEYFERVRGMLENLDPAIAVERLFSRIPEKDAIFSNWQTSWWKLKDEFEAYMAVHESYQGKHFDYRDGSALKGVF